MSLVGFILLDAVEVGSVFVYDDIQRYLSCTQVNVTDEPDYHVDWYWKLGPFLLLGMGRVLAVVSFYVFVIAQSPDKMKGLAVGLMLAVQGAAFYILSFSDPLVFTLCFDILNVVPLVVLLAIFLLSKWYTLCERNGEINKIINFSEDANIIACILQVHIIQKFFLSNLVCIMVML